MYTIVDDGDVLNIRASITDRIELRELVGKLQKRLDGEDVNITTQEKTDERDVSLSSLSARTDSSPRNQ